MPYCQIDVHTNHNCCAAVTFTGLIWSRYSMVIIPVWFLSSFWRDLNADKFLTVKSLYIFVLQHNNISLFSVHIFNNIPSLNGLKLVHCLIVVSMRWVNFAWHIILYSTLHSPYSRHKKMLMTFTPSILCLYLFIKAPVSLSLNFWPCVYLLLGIIYRILGLIYKCWGCLYGISYTQEKYHIWI